MEQTTNIRIIADKLHRHPLLQSINFETIIDYTVDFLRIVGCPTLYLDVVTNIKIANYRAMLPCNYHEMIQVRDAKTKEAYKYTTDSFHLSKDKSFKDELTYKIQGNIIYTSLEETELEVAYRAIATDEEGFPLLPDNSSFTRALLAYIKKEYFTILFDMGKINPNVLLNVLLEYAWAVGDCLSEFNRLSLDKAESLYNSWNSLILKTKEHNSGFRFNNMREQIKIHL